MYPTRRSLLTAILTLPPALILGGGQPARSASGRLAPTPACGEEAENTPALTTGPYYRSDAPFRHDLRADAVGGRSLTLAGFVVDTDCTLIPGALVEIWHADHQGNYDNEGHRLRAQQFTDAAGRWGFSTIETRHYAFRTAHYHFRIRIPNGRMLTTQIYFPDDPRNAEDPLFDARLVMTRIDEGERRIGRYDFVIE